MSMEHWHNATDRGETEVLGTKPVAVPLGSPQIPHGLGRYRTRSSAVRDRQLNARPMGGLLLLSSEMTLAYL
jgi:hypothetical protein